MWFKVDDSFYGHPKVVGLSDSAKALWLCAGSWAARYQTDGKVPADVPAQLCEDPERAVNELLAAGLWGRVKGGGYRFHDWAEYQPLRSQTAGLRLAKRRGAIAANHRRWHIARGLVEPTCELCDQPERPPEHHRTDQTTDRYSDRSANPPVPYPLDQPHVVAPVSDLLHDVVTPAPARDAHTPAREPAHVRTRPPGRSGLPHEAVMAALGAQPSEAHAVVTRLLNEVNAENPMAFVNAAINTGRAQQALTEHRAAVRRAERTAWGERRRAAPECDHGIPGGDWPHFDPPHAPACLGCRLEARRAAG